jgi:hypothetical protein
MVEHSNPGAGFVLPPKTILISTIKTLPDYKNSRVLYQKYVVEGLSAARIAKQTSSYKTSVLEAFWRLGYSIKRKGPTVERPARPPYGKVYHAGELVDHKTERRVIESIITPKYKKGETLRSIASFLESEGLPTKTKKGKWHHFSVKEILRRERIYKSSRRLKRK